MTDVIAEILEARNAGEARIAIATVWPGEMSRALEKFGLKSDASQLFEISRADALELLSQLLTEDMAYHAALMQAEKARSCAERALSEFEGEESHYYTNRAPRTDAWNPMTDATFDCGIIVTRGRNGFFCIWFEDED